MYRGMTIFLHERFAKIRLAAAAQRTGPIGCNGSNIQEKRIKHSSGVRQIPTILADNRLNGSLDAHEDSNLHCLTLMGL